MLNVLQVQYIQPAQRACQCTVSGLVASSHLHAALLAFAVPADRDLGAWHPASILGPWAEPLPGSNSQGCHLMQSLIGDDPEITSLSNHHCVDASWLTK